MLESNLSAATGHRPLGRPLWPAHFLCGLPNGWCTKAINSRPGLPRPLRVSGWLSSARFMVQV
jgi:hypothetical protein